jgi:crotonobetainyl-CoA:carnitine CoA-transferase CaiB-like acyl-CoA transferase
MTRVKPDIIMIRVSIEGQTGPAARHPGFGVVASALGGITNLLGWPDREPSTPFGGYTDITVVQFASGLYSKWKRGTEGRKFL